MFSFTKFCPWFCSSEIRLEPTETQSLLHDTPSDTVVVPTRITESALKVLPSRIDIGWKLFFLFVGKSVMDTFAPWEPLRLCWSRTVTKTTRDHGREAEAVIKRRWRRKPYGIHLVAWLCWVTGSTRAYLRRRLVVGLPEATRPTVSTETDPPSFLTFITLNSLTEEWTARLETHSLSGARHLVSNLT